MVGVWPPKDMMADAFDVDGAGGFFRCYLRLAERSSLWVYGDLTGGERSILPVSLPLVIEIKGRVQNVDAS